MFKLRQHEGYDHRSGVKTLGSSSFCRDRFCALLFRLTGFEANDFRSYRALQTSKSVSLGIRNGIRQIANGIGLEQANYRINHV
jgi:hypothetical protein